MTTTPTCRLRDGSCRGPLHHLLAAQVCTEHLRDLALDAIRDHTDPPSLLAQIEAPDAIDYWATVLHALSGSTPAADVAHILNVEPAR